MAILFGIAAAVGWGVADYIARFASRRTGPFRTLLYMQVVGIAGLLVWFVAAPRSVAPVPSAANFWMWAALSGVLNTMASLAFYRALETGLLTIVSPVCSAYPVVTVLASVYLGEKLSVAHLGGIVFACVGVVLAATSFGPVAATENAGALPGVETSAKARPTRGVALAVLASLMYGLNFVVIGYHITPYLDGVRSVLVLRSVSVVTLLLISVLGRQSIRVSGTSVAGSPVGGSAVAGGSVWLLIAAIGVFDTAAFIASNLGLSTGHVSVVTVLGSLFGAVTVFLGWIFLRERVAKSQWLGVFLIFVGIILVSI